MKGENLAKLKHAIKANKKESSNITTYSQNKRVQNNPYSNALKEV